MFILAENPEIEKGTFDVVLEGYIDFESHPWPSICKSAKDLIRRMLTRCPERRITSSQVLKHQCIKEDGEA
uniref:Calcium-dependent protein kinase 9-like n=1 Tax=Tanacetum cinerariifolium TaxID=118510 RepID=A0A6L2NW22_TANCI|nr:calcium-dependent protein kinase 9-like [Tanacetum cinerariifolium]